MLQFTLTWKSSCQFSGDCAPGHWCIFGVDRQYPDGMNQSSVSYNDSCYDGRMLGNGGICPLGHYCPGGVASVFPLPCDNGTYADEEGLSECKECPLGYWCPNAAVNFTSYPCPEGYFCPAGTGLWSNNPCPAGTYNNGTMKSVLSDCLDCPGGYYCAGSGNPEPSGECDPGYYCSSAAEVSTPAPGSGYGGNCEAGYFCPSGSAHPVPCTTGYYCAVPYLNDTSGECLAGYYCSGYATVANPTDGNITGR